MHIRYRSTHAMLAIATRPCAYVYIVVVSCMPRVGLLSRRGSVAADRNDMMAGVAQTVPLTAETIVRLLCTFTPSNAVLTNLT